MAVPKLFNLARVSCATTGTGTMTLGSAVTGFLSFANAGVSDGDTVTYAVKDGSASEIGRGVYTASGTTLSRTVLKSTNSNNPLNLSGSAEVFITPSAEDFMQVAGWDAGTALLPAIFPSGDTNTGVWFPGADIVAISTSGVERWRVGSTGAHTITAALAAALSVGTNGATNPAFAVDTSASAAATGLAVAAAAAASGVSLSAISSGTDESFKIDAKGAGTITLGGTSTGAINLARAASILAGSVSAPALYATGDTNTGVWFPAADTIALSTAGVERMRVGSTGIVTWTTATSLNIGANGATNPAFKVDASASSAATGLSVTAAAAAAGLALSVLSSGADENFKIDAKGAGTITLGGTSTGNIVISRLLASIAQTITSASATAIVAGLNGANNPAFQVDASTASSATGLKIKSAAAAAGVALSALSSGTDENLTLDAKGAGTLTLNSVATGAIALARVASILSGLVSAPSLYFTGDTNTGLWAPAADTLALSTGGVEALRVDSSGRLLVGNAGASLSVNSLDAQKQLHGTSNATAAFTVGLFDATAGDFPRVQFYRSKNASVGSATVVSSGDVLGGIDFVGAQQTGTFATQNLAARITAAVDGTVTSGAGADMPGRLMFWTTPDGSGTLTERMRIDQAGNISIGSAATPTHRLTVHDTNLVVAQLKNTTTSSSTQGAMLRLISDDGAALASGDRLGGLLFGGSTDASASIQSGAGIYGYTAEAWSGSAQGGMLALLTAAAGATVLTERLRIDQAGRLVIGLAAAAAATFAIGTATPLVQSHAAVADCAQASYSADALGSNLYLAKSRHATPGSHTIVQSGDSLGLINFAGSDGTNFVTAAQIRGALDGTPGASNDMPGRISFWTVPDGSATLAERMRIDNVGNVNIGTTGATAALLTVKAGGSFGAAIRGASSGAVGIGTYPAGVNLGFIAGYTSETLATNTHLLMNPDGGNLGVGMATAPSFILQVGSDSAAKPGVGGLWTVVSDSRLKDGIELADISRCYEIVKTTPLKRFSWKEGVYKTEQVADRTSLGWIADDVETVFPKSVNRMKFTGSDDAGKQLVIEDCRDLNSGQLLAAHYGATQHLANLVEAQAVLIDELTQRLQVLEKR